tara:strand:+ start:1726 stop:2532 length:807 start_codon:yes stop_codon:yes gene_type:complete
MLGGGHAAFDPARPWYRLTLRGVQSWQAFRPPRAPDPLLVWPDAWEPLIHTTEYAKALTWAEAPGIAGSKAVAEKVHAALGWDVATVNYAFNFLFDDIPVRQDTKTKAMVFDIRREERYRENDFRAKQANFWAALKYIQHYPSRTEMRDVLGMSHTTFYNQVSPTINKMSLGIAFLERNLRLWDYNRGEVYMERVLQTFDGFPIAVCASSNKWVRRLTKSKKYQVQRATYNVHAHDTLRMLCAPHRCAVRVPTCMHSLHCGCVRRSGC